jgi:2-polyprenyl-3-methyl-5-hydroxy-6-metoxy-1,4-benzoquinol methylase
MDDLSGPPTGDRTIRNRPKPHCAFCGIEGISLYRDLSDRLYSAPGLWGFRQCPSPDCGLVWLDPSPVEEDLGIAYKKYYTHAATETSSHASLAKRAYRYARDGYLERKFGYDRGEPSSLRKRVGLLLHLLPGRRADLEFSVMYLPSRKGARLLEVGCGGGDMVGWMTDLGWNAEGVDTDPAAVRAAQEKGLRVRLGRMEDQEPFPDRFDAVTMSHLIEHVPDPRRLLRGAWQVLKRGGTVSIVTPNILSLGHRRFGANWFHLDPPRHLHLFHPSLLRWMAGEAGFREIRVSTVIRDAHSLFAASRSIASTGRCAMGPPRGALLAAWSKTLQLREWVELRRDPHAGEEVTLVALK